MFNISNCPSALQLCGLSLLSFGIFYSHLSGKWKENLKKMPLLPHLSWLEGSTARWVWLAASCSRTKFLSRHSVFSQWLTTKVTADCDYVLFNMTQMLKTYNLSFKLPVVRMIMRLYHCLNYYTADLCKLGLALCHQMNFFPSLCPCPTLPAWLTLLHPRLSFLFLSIQWGDAAKSWVTPLAKSGSLIPHTALETQPAGTRCSAAAGEEW